MTHRLYVHFDALDAQRHNVLGPAIRAFINAQRDFYTSSARLLGEIPALPERLAIAPLGTVPMTAASAAASGGGVPAPGGGPNAAPPVPQSTGGSAGASSASAGTGGMAAAMAMPTSAATGASAPPGGANAATSSMTTAGGAAGGDTVRAVYAYKPVKPDELELHPGDIVNITRRNPDGWFVGTTTDGRSGAFPGNYVTAVPAAGAPST